MDALWHFILFAAFCHAGHSREQKLAVYWVPHDMYRAALSGELDFQWVENSIDILFY